MCLTTIVQVQFQNSGCPDLCAVRLFRKIMNMFTHMGNMGHSTYHTLCDSYVLLLADYGAVVWGFTDYPAPHILQNRMGRFFLGVHCFTPLAATTTEVDTSNIQYLCWIEMAWLYNCIQKMDEYRISKVILNWDFMCYMKR